MRSMGEQYKDYQAVCEKHGLLQPDELICHSGKTHDILACKCRRCAYELIAKYGQGFVSIKEVEKKEENLVGIASGAVRKNLFELECSKHHNNGLRKHFASPGSFTPSAQGGPCCVQCQIENIKKFAFTSLYSDEICPKHGENIKLGISQILFKEDDSIENEYRHYICFDCFYEEMPRDIGRVKLIYKKNER
jgi:hypothetical protein